MGAIAFDTYKFIKKLEVSGFKEEQAEALSEAIKEVQETHMEELATKYDVKDMATKADIAGLRQSTKTDIAELRQSTKADIAELRQSTKADIAELRQSTKADIAGLRESTKADIAELRQSTKLDIAEVKGELRLLKWMIGFMFAGVFSLVLKAFFV